MLERRQNFSTSPETISDTLRRLYFNVRREVSLCEIKGPGLVPLLIQYAKLGRIGQIIEWLAFTTRQHEKFIGPATALLIVQEVYGKNPPQCESQSSDKVLSPEELIRGFYITPDGRAAQSDDQAKRRPKIYPDALKLWRDWVLKIGEAQLPTERDLFSLLLTTRTHDLDRIVEVDRRKVAVALGLLIGAGIYVLTNNLIPPNVNIGDPLKIITTLISGTGGIVTGAAIGRRFKEKTGPIFGGIVGGITGAVAPSVVLPDEFLIRLEGLPEYAVAGVAALGLNAILGRVCPIAQPSGRRLREIKKTIVGYMRDIGESTLYLFPSIVGLYDRRWIRTKTKTGTLDLRERFHTDLIMQKIGTSSDRLISTVIGTNFANEANIPQEILELVRQAPNFSSVLERIALIGALRQRIKLPRNEDLQTFFKERGGSRLSVLKMFSGDKPDLALAVALPAVNRIYWELGLRRAQGEDVNLLRFWPGAYYDAKLYGQRGDNWGNKGELLPLQRAFWQEQARQVGDSSYLNWVFQLDPSSISRRLKNPITEVTNTPLLEEALSVLALFYHDLGQNGASGSLKHALKAYVAEFLRSDEGTMNLATVISAINFYIKAGEFLKEVYGESSARLFDQAISNLRTFRNEIIQTTLNNALADPRRLIIEGETSADEIRRLSYLFYWIDRECSEELKGAVSLIRDLFSASGQKGEKVKKSTALLSGLATILKFVKNRDIKKSVISLLSNICADIIENDLDLSEGGNPERFSDQEFKGNVLYFLEKSISIILSSITCSSNLEQSFFEKIRELLKRYIQNSESLVITDNRGIKSTKREFVEAVLSSISMIASKFSREHQRELINLINFLNQQFLSKDGKANTVAVTIG